MRIKFLVILFIGFSPALYTQNKIISDIIIEGNQKTKIDFITSFLLTKKGQQLDSVRLEKDMVQLKRLPALSHAYYQVNSINESNCIIKVYVEENFTVIPEVNFWTFTNNQFSYRLGSMIIISLAQYCLWRILSIQWISIKKVRGFLIDA